MIACANQRIGLDLNLAGELVGVFALLGRVGAVGAAGELFDRVDPHVRRVEAGAVVLGIRPAAVTQERSAAGEGDERSDGGDAERTGARGSRRRGANAESLRGRDFAIGC